MTSNRDADTPAYPAHKEGENVNCLAGMRCPACKSPGPFRIKATSVFLVFDDGTDSHEDVEWDADAEISCAACGNEGTVEAFTQRRCTICEELAHPQNFRDHLAGHSTAAESAIDDPAEFFQETSDEPTEE